MPLLSTIFKDHLPNHLANQSQILFGGSVGRVKESLFELSRSHDQGDMTMPIYGKNL